jgi:CheY-like chemotaxis protein/anti-sigma regulatory factor (Ser/Thr protein kinase)
MKKILVIDDAEFILESTSTLLKFEGYDVVTACDGEEGVKKAVAERPDLILCDISMPKLDGYGALEQIRKNPNTSTTPFIFLTAFTEKSNMRAGMEKGADDFLVKPYTRDELIHAIDAQWNKHQLIEKQVQEKVQEVGRSVTYALPHEFRTVLNEVIGSAKYLNTAADDVKPDEVRELAGDIISSSNRLMKITENFLAYVRIESFFSNPTQRSQLRTMTTMEPSAMYQDIASLIAERYGRMDDLEFGESVDNICAQISSESFHKIIDELVDNSFRFSQPGGKVAIRSRIEEDFLYISISDQGRGMSKEQIAGVAALAQFERTIYEQQGVGLGLVIAKRMTELHDGSFEIISEEGKGCEIIFSLHYEKNA